MPVASIDSSTTETLGSITNDWIETLYNYHPESPLPLKDLPFQQPLPIPLLEPDLGMPPLKPILVTGVETRRIPSAGHSMNLLRAHVKKRQNGRSDAEIVISVVGREPRAGSHQPSSRSHCSGKVRR